LARFVTSVLSDQPGTFGPPTRAAVEAFQRQRGLRIDGIVGRHTWATLVEAGFGLGDRLLYRADPLLRGDDVADLQTRLCSLGFDTGRVDGIYGEATAHAVAEFQRNLKLSVDGIAGSTTIDELARIGGNTGTSSLVTTVREQANRHHASSTLEGTRIGLTCHDELSNIAAGVGSRLGAAGALVVSLGGSSEVEHAAEANTAQVDLVISLHLGALTRIAHYRSHSYESVAGQELSALLATALSTIPGISAEPEGMYFALLRETKMVAVVIELAASDTLAEQASDIASAITSATVTWATGASIH
jgi:N-acetylmuramoyl-L-alanine amidase